MSTSSTISNLQQALNCAGKCDCCASLQSQINQLKAQIAGLKNIDENALINHAVEKAKEVILPAAAITATGIVINKTQPIQSQINALEPQVHDAVLGGQAGRQAKARVEDLSQFVNTVDTKATNAISDAASASRQAINAANEVSGLKGIIEGVKSNVNRLGNLVYSIEKTATDALFKAGKAIGLSENALRATGRLAGQVLQIFNTIATIFTLIEQLAIVKIIDDRVSAVEREVLALGRDLSGLLGRLLGIQNRISRAEGLASEARGVASDAIQIGNEAARIGRSAYQTAGVAVSNASQAQTTADGAVRNASRANENATTAFNKANEAKGIGEQAKQLGSQALQKAGEALGVGLTALSLYQLLKLRPGVPGRPGRDGLPGRNGLNGRNGLDGRPGRDGLNGITQVIQIPGTPGRNGRDGITRIITLPGRPGRDGRDGRDGINGINGRNGIDVDNSQLAGINSQLSAIRNQQNIDIANGIDLRGFIAAQHQGTRANSSANHLSTQANVNNTTTTVVGGLTAYVVTQFGIVIASLTTIGTQLFNFINWAVIDRVLNLIILATTIHNALMLSNNLGQTLLSLISNVLSVFGIKNSEGQPFDISAIIGSAVETFIKGIIGEENYKILSENWKKANRIYQATANLLNSIQSIGASILNALEVVGSWVALIGNALRKWGAIWERAYNWMNPQVNFQNKFFTSLETATNVVSQIDAVAAETLSIKETVGQLAEQKTELDNSLKQSEESKQRSQPPAEAEKIKQQETESKTASAASDLQENDKEPDEDDN